MLKPDGTPDGQVAGSVIAPAALVARLSERSIGTGRSRPPLKGVGLLDKPTHRSAGEDALAFVSWILIGLPAVCFPEPPRTGSPLTPASAEPSSIHVLAGAGERFVWTTTVADVVPMTARSLRPSRSKSPMPIRLSPMT